jgi:hypothetical protein
MWQPLRDIVDNVKQSLGTEVPAAPDTSAVTDTASDAAGQASDAAATAADAAASATTDAATAAGEAVTGVGEQISSKVSDFLGRFGG